METESEESLKKLRTWKNILPRSFTFPKRKYSIANIISSSSTIIKNSRLQVKSLCNQIPTSRVKSWTSLRNFSKAKLSSVKQLLQKHYGCKAFRSDSTPKMECTTSDDDYQVFFCNTGEEDYDTSHEESVDEIYEPDYDFDDNYDTDIEDVEDTILDWNKTQVGSYPENVSHIEQLMGESLEDGDQVFTWDTSTQDFQKVDVFVYKPVHKRVKPVPAVFPQEAAVTRRIPVDPLSTLPELSKTPPDFIPTERLTQQRLNDMNINETNFLLPEEVKLFHEVLRLNDATLAFDESQRGNFSEEYFSPYIIPTVPHVPWVQKNTPVPPGIKDQVIEILKDKIKNGVLEHCQSSYRSHWFCVLKKNGKLRIVYDLQKLNSITIRDAGLPPILDGFVEPFAGGQCYTVFDMCSGFDARTLHPDSRDLTAVSTPLGLLRLTCLPQGFTNSPAEFQKCMLFILKDEIPHVANIFIDDLPIKGPTTQYPDKDGNPEMLKENPGIRRFIWEHANDVHRIMHRIKCANVSFEPKKAQICRPEVVIIGHKCTPEGRLPEDDKVQKVMNWPVPTNTKEVRGFLGLCGTVRIWIKDYSQLTRPLSALYKKNAEFIWTEECTEAFNTLKCLVSSAPALRPIDYSADREVIMSVDTSQTAVGFILSQLDEEGKRRPARYGSLPMNEREARYSQPKLELYGLYRALRHWRVHLVGVKKLTIEVDAKYINGMLKEPDLQPNAAMNRWIQGILTFDFTLKHIPAAKFKGPDGLSRRPKAEDEEIIDDDEEWLDKKVLAIQVKERRKPSATQVLITRTSQEQLLHDVLKYLITQQLPDQNATQAYRRFVNNVNKFQIHGNTLVKVTPEGHQLTVILKESDRQDILRQAHDDLGHRGVRVVFDMLKFRFFWPEMYQDIKRYTKSCHHCQLRSLKKYRIPITVSTPATLFSKIYIDVMNMTPAPAGDNEPYRYIVAARDDLSGACEAKALRHATAAELEQFFKDQILYKYGMVQHIVTDNGSENKKEFEELLKRMELPHIKISGYNSRANGVVEKGHFTLREALVKSCEGNLDIWPQKLQQAVFADWITTSSVTGYSPYYLMYGQHPVLPFDIAQATFMIEGYKEGLSTSDLLALRIRQLDKHPEDISRAAKTLEKHRCHSKEIFEEKFKYLFHKMEFSPGQLVLMRNSAIEKSLDRKCKPRYLGPYIIHRITQGGSYVLKELDGTQMREKVAAFRIAPYIARDRRSLAQLANCTSDIIEVLEEKVRKSLERTQSRTKKGRAKKKRA